MIRLLGSRGASAVMGLLMLALVSSEASAQTVAQSPRPFDIAAAVRATESESAAKPSGTLGTAAQPTSVTTLTQAILPVQQAVATVAGSAAPAIAREAAWLYQNGWPLYALVGRYSAGAPLDEQANCIATAVYFEARGESLAGQMAVARVIMNRAASGRYPPSWCGTVKQPWQFSFVRNGRFPAIHYGSQAWRDAQAITRLAVNNVVPSLSSDVLWYHADYVAPSWGRRLTRVEKIGTHIFYRA